MELRFVKRIAFKMDMKGWDFVCWGVKGLEGKEHE